MAKLGAGITSVRIDEARTGRAIWQSGGRNASRIDWERSLNETAQAVIEFQASGSVANLLEPWLNTVSIFRNEELVWYGIVYRVEAKAGGFVKVVAKDPSIYFDYRRVAQARRYRNADASLVFSDIVTDAMGFDDPLAVCSYLVSSDSGVWITKEIQPAVRMLRDEVNDLVAAGLNWTYPIGRLLAGMISKGYQTQLLQDRDFSDSLTVIKDGAEVATDVLVQGKGVYGYYIDEARQLGYLQSIIKADSLVRVAECKDLGRKRVLEAHYAPRRIGDNGSMTLLPGAPVAINELLPGVLIPVSSARAGVLVNSTMMLKSVAASVSAGVEAVSITLCEVASSFNRELWSKKVEEEDGAPYDMERASKERVEPRPDGEKIPPPPVM